VIEDVNATQKRLTLVVVVVIPRASHVVSENIQVALDTDDLMFHNTYSTPSFVVGGIAQTNFIDRGEGQVSGIGSGSQSHPLSFEEFLTASIVMEPREDEFLL
jgi:hypothetical protein